MACCMLSKVLRQPEPSETAKTCPSSSVLQSIQGRVKAWPQAHPLSSLRGLCKQSVYHIRFLPRAAESCPIGLCSPAGEGGGGMSFSARHIIRGVARRSAMHAIRRLSVRILAL